MVALAVLTIVLGLLILLVVLWLVLGRGPRLSRAYRRIQNLLHDGDWAQALQLTEELQKQPDLAPDDTKPASRLASVWKERLRNAAADSHQAAADAALKEKRYEEALEHVLQAAALLGTAEKEARGRVVDAMLAEIRRLFAAGTGTNETAAVLQMVPRTLAVQSPCPEASFWQSLCLIRQNQLEPALNLLLQVHEQAGKNHLDPAFYIGGVLHRLGRPQEGVRYLAEANKVDSTCPFITWQMGISLVAGNGDSGLAVRALQRALGSRGLPLWSQTPRAVWIEAFPEGKSYVRRLAARHPYVCPLLGNDLAAIIRQGQMALAQAQYRQGNFQESADLFAKLMQDTAPTLPLLRGLGLSLARLHRYDQAYKHLRTALELDEGKDAFTAGYLALCGAMGKPTNPDDKPKNIAWAIRLLARYPMSGNAEWAKIYSDIFAEARSLNMPLSQEDQVQLCNVLASVNAVDQAAATAYGHLAATYPEAIVPRFAWLYCQSATIHGIKSPRDLDLFARTFREPQPAKEFFGRQQWNLDDVQYTYLARSAVAAPGRFPEPLPSPQGEAFLLVRSQKEEEAGRKDAALQAAEVLVHLSPRCLPGYDRLACLYYRKGDLEKAVTWLAGWARLDPADHWPLVRQAIIEQQRGNVERRAEVVNQALGLTQGPLRAAIAFLGAKLALRESVKEWEKERTDSAPGAMPTGPGALVLVPTLTLLQECLKDDPEHVEALWCLAAVRSVLGDKERLKEQAAFMDKPAVKDARFHYLGAVCHLAKQDYQRVLELGQRAAADESLAAESHYLMAWAHLHLKNPAAATQSLQKVAAVEKSPSAIYARALLGHLSFERHAYDDAIKWWNQVDARRRTEWRLDESLRQTVLLAGLMNFEKGRYEQAADRFKEAGKLGLRDKRLGSLLTLALVKAGQRLLFEQAKTP